MKIDMRNAFNLVWHQALLDECSAHFTLWHPMGIISSDTGVQQGDPLGPMFFCLVPCVALTGTAIATDDDCYSTDDGVVAGPKWLIFSIIQKLGPPLGLFTNAQSVKCLAWVISAHFHLLWKHSVFLTLTSLLTPSTNPMTYCASIASAHGY